MHAGGARSGGVSRHVLPLSLRRRHGLALLAGALVVGLLLLVLLPAGSAELPRGRSARSPGAKPRGGPVAGLMLAGGRPAALPKTLPVPLPGGCPVISTRGAPAPTMFDIVRSSRRRRALLALRALLACWTSAPVRRSCTVGVLRVGAGAGTTTTTSIGPPHGSITPPPPPASTLPRPGAASPPAPPASPHPVAYTCYPIQVPIAGSG